MARASSPTPRGRAWPTTTAARQLLKALARHVDADDLDLATRLHRVCRRTETHWTSHWEDDVCAFVSLALGNVLAIVEAFENHLVDQALSRTGNNKNRASELLQMNRTTLVEKLRKRGMIQTVGSRNRMKDAAASGIAAGQMNDAVLVARNPVREQDAADITGTLVPKSRDFGGEVDL